MTKTSTRSTAHKIEKNLALREVLFSVLDEQFIIPGADSRLDDNQWVCSGFGEIPTGHFAVTVTFNVFNALCDIDLMFVPNEGNTLVPFLPRPENVSAFDVPLFVEAAITAATDAVAVVTSFAR